MSLWKVLLFSLIVACGPQGQDSKLFLKNGIGFAYDSLNLKLNTSKANPWRLDFSLPKAQGANNSGIEYVLIKRPTEGILIDCINPNNRTTGLDCIYWPYVNGGSSDSFEYRAYQGDLVSQNIFRVNITFEENANNDPYFLEGEQYFATTAGKSISVNLLPAYNIETNETITYKLDTEPGYGTLSNCLTKNSFSTQMSCSYTPDTDFTGLDSFSYLARDSSNHTSQHSQVVYIIVNPSGVE